MLSCSTNKSLSTKWDVPLVGCASHRWNLGVRRWIDLDEGVPGLAKALKRLSKLFKKASTLKHAARLRELTRNKHGRPLSAKQENATRWTSSFIMVERYLKIKEEIVKVKGLEKYQLSQVDIACLEAAKVHFKRFNCLTKLLQEEGTSMLEVRNAFDMMLNKELHYHAAFHDYIDERGRIIHNKFFENGCISILRGEVNSMTSDERNACKRLRHDFIDVNANGLGDSDAEDEDPAPQPPVEEPPSPTFEDRLAMNFHKKRKTDGDGSSGEQFISQGEYVDPAGLIPPTSNCCERLFSECKYTLVPHRRGMSPKVFRALMMLKKNARFWNVDLVGR